MSNPNKDAKEFAGRLKVAREARELSQALLAEKSNLAPSAIAHFEGARRKPSFANIRALSQALEISSDYLLGRSSKMKGETTVFRGEEKLSSEDRDWIQSFIDSKTNQESK